MLKVGYAQSVITPPLPIQLAGHRGPRLALEVGDDLMARALVFSYRDALVALISIDLIWLPRRIVARVRDLVSRTVAVRPENLMVTCTHTHSGPDTLGWYPFSPPVSEWWIEWLVNSLTSTVFQAARRLKEVGLRLGTAGFPLSTNRRLLSGGTVYREPNPQGPVDDKVVVMTFNSSDRVVCGIVHAAMHPVILGADSLKVSGDWCGEMVRRLASNIGGGWIFLNGCAGDNNPKQWSGGSYQDMISVGAAAAECAEAAISGAAAMTTDALWGASKSRLFDHQAHPYLSVEQRRRINEDGGIKVEGQVIRLGDVEIVGVAGECLQESGEMLRDGSSRRLIVSYANDYIGYLPRAKHYAEGGYEAAASMLSQRGAEEYLSFLRRELLSTDKLVV